MPVLRPLVLGPVPVLVPMGFMADTTSGEVSYYAKMMHFCDMSDHPHSDLKFVVKKMKEMHQEQFGV